MRNQTQRIFASADRPITAGLQCGDIEKIVAGDSQIDFQYDENGNLIGQTDGGNTEVEYIYDEIGNVIGKKVTEEITEDEEVNEEEEMPEEISFFGKFKFNLVALTHKIRANVFADDSSSASQDVTIGYDSNNNPSDLSIALPIYEETIVEEPAKEEV